MDRRDKAKEIEVWRLEQEGEAEKPEATGLGSQVKGVSKNPEGESRHGQVRAKMARKERENQTQMEEKVEVVTRVWRFRVRKEM